MRGDTLVATLQRFEGIKVISPLVEKPPMHTKFLGQARHVVADIQSLDSYAAEDTLR
jgi:hypothetical protein